MSDADVEQLQTAIAGAVREYARRRQEGEAIAPVGAESVTATEVAITVTALLEVVDIEVFELALWASWGRA
jgi:hypothetical protein